MVGGPDLMTYVKPSGDSFADIASLFIILEHLDLELLRSC